jgi:hypothetical protein
MGTFAKSIGPTDLFTVTFVAEGAITENALVIPGTSQHQVKVCATANAKNVLGTCVKTGGCADGDNCPVRLQGLATVIADDGNIFNGAFLYAGPTTKTRVRAVASGVPTADFNIVGRALAASNAAGDSIVMEILKVPSSTFS